jgi:hypothetical protein
VTDFEQKLRHYCRNPRCRMKLQAPVENPHRAFCTRGCYLGFFRTRCLVCEGAMQRKTETQLVCGKRKCRSTLKGGAGRFRYPTTHQVVGPLKSAANTGLKTRGNGDRSPRPPFSITDALKNARSIVGPAHVIAVEIGRSEHASWPR